MWTLALAPYWALGAKKKVSALGTNLVFAEVDVARRAIFIQTKIELQARFTLQPKVKAIDHAAGTPIKRQRTTHHADSVLRIDSNQRETDNLRTF